MESAQAKNQALQDAGATVPTSFEALEVAIKETFDKLVSLQSNAVLACISLCCDLMFMFFLSS